MSEDEVPVTLKTSPKQLERTATVSVRASNRIRGLLERISKSVNIASSDAKNEYGQVADDIRDDTVLLKGLMDKSDESSSHLVRRAFERADEGAKISKHKAKILYEDLQEYVFIYFFSFFQLCDPRITLASLTHKCQKKNSLENQRSNVVT